MVSDSRAKPHDLRWRVVEEDDHTLSVIANDLSLIDAVVLTHYLYGGPASLDMIQGILEDE
jgi:hypothetical protein